MPSTYTLISSNVLATSAASVTFSDIPSTYTDLVLKVNGRGTDTGNYLSVQLRFNSDTATNYSRTALFGYGPGGSLGSTRGTSLTFTTAMYSANSNDATANTFGNAEFYIANYLVSANKPISSFGVAESNTGQGFIDTTAHLWRNTSAITSITINPFFGGSLNWITGSSFYLYGIKNS
jgi:hypothetical protein